VLALSAVGPRAEHGLGGSFLVVVAAPPPLDNVTALGVGELPEFAVLDQLAEVPDVHDEILALSPLKRLRRG